MLFPKNSPTLWTTYFKESSFISNNCFLYLLEKFLANDRTPYPLTYFLVLGSIEHRAISTYNKQCQINFAFYF